MSDMNFAGGTMSATLVRVRRNDDEDEALFILMCISIKVVPPPSCLHNLGLKLISLVA